MRPCCPRPWPPSSTPPTRRQLLSRYAFDPEAARRELGRALGTLFLDGFGVEDHRPGGGRGGGHPPLSARFPHPGAAPPGPAAALSRDDYLGLDEATLRHLEIFETWRSRSRQGSLLDALDCTVTPMGARRLGRWLRYPLKELAAIEARLDGGGVFFEPGPAAAPLAPDPQGPGRPGAPHRPGGPGAGHPPGGGRHQSGPGKAARCCRELLPGEAPPPGGGGGRGTWTRCPDLQELISRALVDDPPLSLQEGGIIREGYDAGAG